MTEQRGSAHSGRQVRRPHYAVIGSGAAAFGVIDTLLASASEADLTLIDLGKETPDPPRIEGHDNLAEIADGYGQLYRELFNRQPRQFPPPKTYGGHQISRHHLKTGEALYKSQTFGGLTQFWGGTMLPFTEAEMRPWPFEAKRLDPFYTQIAERVGISGGTDPLLTYFGRDYATRPAIKPLPVLQRLGQVVNERGGTAGDECEVVAGANRCALDTRPASSRGCVYCGECMAGCFRGSVFSAADAIRPLLSNGRIRELIEGRVTHLDLKRRTITIDKGAGPEHLSGFSKVFLCAGCIGSTEIVMRSTGMTSGPVMSDNAVYVFPIFNFGRAGRWDRSRYLALCNLIFGCMPKDGRHLFAQAQIYPNFDYMWRYNTPPVLWPMLAPLVRASRSRIFWGRLYLHGDLSPSYALNLDEGRLMLEVARSPDASAEVGRLMRAIRKAIGGRGFFVPPLPPIRQRTNSHYGATLPFGNSLVDVPSSGEIGDGVYLCDSAAFPEIPAVSLTFSIMANAARIASEAIQD